MRPLGISDAAARSLVRLPDGRTGRLLFWPSTVNHHSRGAKARVRLPSGAVITVRPEELTREEAT